MTEVNNLVKETLMTQVRLNTEELKTNYSKLDNETKRHVAVATALELIRADVSSAYSTGGTSQKTGLALQQHMESLEAYSNYILSAMEVSE